MSVTATPGYYFRPRRIGHVNYWVDNMAEVTAFYHDVVGIEEAYRRDAIKAVFLSNGNTYHDVAFMDLSSPRGEGHQVGLHHFSLELTNEEALVAGYQACVPHGYAFDFTISADVTRSAYGSDPDGNRFEVYADVKKDWRSERSGAVSSGGGAYTPGATPPMSESCFPVNPEIVEVEGALIKPQRLSHVVLVAKHYEAMLRHYSDVAGLTILAGGMHLGFAIMGGTLGEETLAIFRDRGYRTAGIHHAGYQMRDEAALDAALDRLEQHGLAPLIEIDHATRRGFFLRDPAGQRLQFYVDRREDHAAWLTLDEEAALMVA